MSTLHDTNHPTVRPNRCLRHHVWLAACENCREAHAHLLRRSGSRPGLERAGG